MNIRSQAVVILRWFLFCFLLVGLPLLGIVVAGRDPMPYLEFPPLTRYVAHAAFSWAWFCFYGLIDLLLIGWLSWAVFLGQKRKPQTMDATGNSCVFPWWGVVGLGICLIFWLLAWTRLTWFRSLQMHTFQPIWGGFILAINAFSVKRSGSCLMLRRPLGFMLLFPASAAFWWFYEYLNRFAQNWYYTGIEGLGAGQYVFFSSLAFATVLPGVLSMIDLLLTVPALGTGLARCRPINLPSAAWIPLAALTLLCVGLALIGVYPDQLFALLWVSPLIIILCMQRLIGQRTLLYPLRRGDWRPVVVPALAALTCGFFWEMWNFFSLARWTYTIPFVERFFVFEMPILGFGGYLPFGLACLVVGALVIGDPFNRNNA